MACVQLCARETRVLGHTGRARRDLVVARLALIARTHACDRSSRRRRGRARRRGWLRFPPERGNRGVNPGWRSCSSPRLWSPLTRVRPRRKGPRDRGRERRLVVRETPRGGDSSASRPCRRSRPSSLRVRSIGRRLRAMMLATTPRAWRSVRVFVTDHSPVDVSATMSGPDPYVIMSE